MQKAKKTFKTITVRLTEEEHKKLIEFAENHKISINNFLKKSIAMGFNLKSKNISNNSQFLSAPVKPQQHTIIDKVIMHACLEVLCLMRENKTKEALNKARDFAKDKTNEYAGN